MKFSTYTCNFRSNIDHDVLLFEIIIKFIFGEYIAVSIPLQQKLNMPFEILHPRPNFRIS